MHSWNCPDDYEARRQARWDAERDHGSGWGRSYSSPYGDCEHADEEYRRAYEREYEEREAQRADERRQERIREERRQEEEYYLRAQQQAAEEEEYWRQQQEAYWEEQHAQAIEAGTAETEGLGPKDESAVRQDAPVTPSQGDTNGDTP